MIVLQHSPLQSMSAPFFCRYCVLEVTEAFLHLNTSLCHHGRHKGHRFGDIHHRCIWIHLLFLLSGLLDLITKVFGPIYLLINLFSKYLLILFCVLGIILKPRCRAWFISSWSLFLIMKVLCDSTVMYCVLLFDNSCDEQETIGLYKFLGKRTAISICEIIMEAIIYWVIWMCRNKS